MKTASSHIDEPCLQTAFGWWDELPDKWTPVGWKNHLMRFNILWNGTIVPFPNPAYGYDAAEWADQGAQLTFDYSHYGSAPHHDNNSAIQGWNEGSAPVLWTRWIPCIGGRVAPEGIEVKQEVFAHISGGREIETGIEPLFLWIRLSIIDQCEGLPLDPTHSFRGRINLPHIFWGGMIIRHNLDFQRDKSLYPREFKPESESYDKSKGWRLIEPDERIRLGVPKGQKCKLSFIHRQEMAFTSNQLGMGGGALCTPNDSLLSLEVENKIGSFVDLLLPLVPTEREVFERELALGYDGALKEANRYWAALPKTAARWELPEDHLNRLAQRQVQMTEVIAQRNPNNGHYHLVMSSWIYSSTYYGMGTALTLIFSLDAMGQHDAVRRYLEPYKAEQGEHKSSSDYIKDDSGYLHRPGWISDHGAILWVIAEHALLTNDQQYIKDFLPCLIKACDWILKALAVTDHPGVKGLLPPAHATDNDTRIQAIWNDGWTYKGLDTAARLLRRINHQRADEMTRAVTCYKKIFGKALHVATRKMPVWKDAKGVKRHLVPTVLDQTLENINETRNSFYSDCGPLFLVFAGLLDSKDELIQATLKWFRKGPPTRFYRYDSSCWFIASLRKEMPINEISYAWNVFCSWHQGDRARFLEGIYSMAAASSSRQTFTVCECRGGVTGLTPGYNPLLWHMRNAMIDDQLVESELHLLRLAPLAWLRKGKLAKMERMPTEYGPVTLGIGLSRDGKKLKVEFKPRWHAPPSRTILHVPPVAGIKKIMLNGKALVWDGKKKSILLRTAA